MAQRQQWEYGAVIIELFPSSGDGGQLNQWGKDGWELITIISSADGNGRMWHEAIFKRPLLTEPDPG